MSFKDQVLAIFPKAICEPYTASNYTHVVHVMGKSRDIILRAIGSEDFAAFGHDENQAWETAAHVIGLMMLRKLENDQ